jgi:hypothetical protein
MSLCNFLLRPLAFSSSCPKILPSTLLSDILSPAFHEIFYSLSAERLTVRWTEREYSRVTQCVRKVAVHLGSKIFSVS